MQTYNFPQRRERRREDARVRQAARDARSPQQQLDSLDESLGKDQGACRERARLKLALKGDGENRKK